MADVQFCSFKQVLQFIVILIVVVQGVYSDTVGSRVVVGVGTRTVTVGSGVAVAEGTRSVDIRVGVIVTPTDAVAVGTPDWVERTWTATQKVCPNDSAAPLSICQ